MPHVQIDYSSNLEACVDISAFCEALRATAASIETFPTAGIRIRALCAQHYAIADGNPDYGFIDISVRLRAGRSLELRKNAARSLFATAESFLADVIANRPVALSLEMRDIDPDLSPKLNTIRKYIAGAS